MPEANHTEGSAQTNALAAVFDTGVVLIQQILHAELGLHPEQPFLIYSTGVASSVGGAG